MSLDPLALFFLQPLLRLRNLLISPQFRNTACSPFSNTLTSSCTTNSWSVIKSLDFYGSTPSLFIKRNLKTRNQHCIQESYQNTALHNWASHLSTSDKYKGVRLLGQSTIIFTIKIYYSPRHLIPHAVFGKGTGTAQVCSINRPENSPLPHLKITQNILHT